MSFAKFFSRGIAGLAAGVTDQEKSGRKRLGKAVTWPILFLLLLMVSTILPTRSVAQGTTGSITGTVLDPSGAIITGAKVSVRNSDTNAQFSATSSSNGGYTLTGLQPGVYVLSVEAEGFKTVQQSGIRLQINQVAEINPKLVVGSNSEQIIVTAGAPVLQTEDASIGLVIQSEAIQNTPLNGRLNIMGLLGTAPGVQSAGAQDQMPIYGVTPAIGNNSRAAYGNTYCTLDGASNNFQIQQRCAGEVPPLDGIGEFKVLTMNAPAEFPTPSAVVVVSKGGGNAFHGELVEFNRVASTAAKYYFNGAQPRPKYIRNEFGGNVSGPIIIPGYYDGKDSSFFMFNFEQFRLAQAASLSSQNATPAMKNGDFSAVGTIIDPLTGAAFAGNVIPQYRINTVSQKIQNLLFPLPTTSGTGTNTYELVPYTSLATRYSFRVDHKLNQSNQVRATFLYALYGPNPSVGATSKAGGMQGIGEHNLTSTVGWTHMYSPTLLLDVNLGFHHFPLYRIPQNVNTKWESIIPGLATQNLEGAPQISIKNITGVSEAGSFVLGQNGQIDASITKVLSKHTIKAGWGILYDNTWNNIASSPQRGSYSFNGQYSGVGYADFLLGYPTATAQAYPAALIVRDISLQTGAYVEDTWRLSRRLTVDAGLRADFQKLFNSPYGNGSLYIPSLKEVVVFASSYPAANSVVPALQSFLNGSIPIVLAPTVNMPTNVWQYLGQKNNRYAPRLGFAYQIGDKTVLRGATGMYYQLLGSYIWQNPSVGNLPFQGTQNFTQPTGSVPSFTMYNPFPSTAGAFTSNPSVNAQTPTQVPYTLQYNLALERQLTPSTGLRIGYVGQHNVHQVNTLSPDINMPALSAGAIQPKRPVQPFASINAVDDNLFHSLYNSLQVGLHRQFTAGLMLSAEYSWTRLLGTETIMNTTTPNPTNNSLVPLGVRDSYGNLGGVTPHSLVVNYSYVLPFGHNKKLLATAGPLVNAFVSGWQISGITTVLSGQPFSVSYSTSLQGSANSRANQVPGVALYPAKKTKAAWFNTAAFVAPAPYTYGTSAYNMLRGPGYQNWDLNLQKNIRLLEKATLQLRADSFNVFNHPNFNTPNANISNSANFGTVTSQNGESRTVEFAGKLSF